MLVKNNEDLYELLDSLLREPTEFWNTFYKDKEKNVPFFCDRPDEHLVKYIERQIIKPRKVLEIGCGNGRNAIYLAQKGCTVTAVDLSQRAIDWAKEQANVNKVNIQFVCENIFNLNLELQEFDYIYDSGCFHHLSPHRRVSYIQFINKYLKNNGYFSISAFKENGKYGGSSLSDKQYYMDRTLYGGLGYSKEKLQILFSEFQEIEIRDMQHNNLNHDEFGLEDFIVCIFKKV
ncbi:class I SAM-dependent methyltransferase [Solibacillus sp. FSL K6-1781]|uniref:class I SAM-dependent methyltransferase n=1 Tax=Solibacillus sp. FSL K6-1781 TaxID=2921474 RepID=UPI00315A472D